MKRRTQPIVVAAALLWWLTAATATAQQTWWGLWKTTMGTAERMLLDDDWHDHYVRLSAQNSPLLVGGQLHGVRFWIYDKTLVESASVWVSATYPGVNGTPTVVRQAVSTSELRDVLHDGQPTEVRFDASYDVLPAGNPYATIYVGYTQKLTYGSLSYLMASAGASTVNSNFHNGNDVSGSFGALAVQVLASGPRMAERGVTPQAPAPQIAVAGTEAPLTVPMVTNGSEAVSTVDYVVSIDGTPQAPQHYELPQPLQELGVGFDVPTVYTAPAEAVEHALTVSVTHVNGQPVAADDEATTTLTVLDRATTRRTVMEEFTGSWCPYCVRGIVGMQRLMATFGDRFIPIAVHGRDPMSIDGYTESRVMTRTVARLGGYPSAIVDRRYECDPYCGWAASGPWATEPIIADALAVPTVADIDVAAAWTDDTHKAIRYDVSTRFGYSSPEAPYAVTLVLTADGLTGEGREWYQVNGYNDYDGDDDGLRSLAGQGEYLPDPVFNHAAIDVVGVDTGISGSIHTPLTAGQTQTFTYTLDVSANELVQDPDRLTAVALLVDTRDGTLVNAAHSPVGTGSTGVRSIRQDGRSAAGAVYDLQGRPVRQPSHGVYIVWGRKVVR